MSIRRSADRPNDYFTIVANDFARDDRLSFKARGIALYLLSHDVGFTTDTEALAKAGQCGVDLVRSGLKELEQYGYLTRDRARDDHGRLGGIDYTVTDNPICAGQDLNGEIQRRETLGRETRPYKKTKGLEEQETPSTSTIADATADDDQPPLVEAGVEPVADKPQRPEVEQLCSRLADLVEGNGARRPVITKAWRDAARLLLDRDKAPLNQVTYVLDWCQRDEFWRVNVLSMPTFRKQYDRLAMKARQEAERRRNGQVNGRDVQDMRAAVAMRRAAMNVDGDF